jgi:hypothetical protein
MKIKFSSPFLQKRLQRNDNCNFWGGLGRVLRLMHTRARTRAHARPSCSRAAPTRPVFGESGCGTVTTTILVPLLPRQTDAPLLIHVNLGQPAFPLQQLPLYPNAPPARHGWHPHGV